MVVLVVGTHPQLATSEDMHTPITESKLSLSAHGRTDVSPVEEQTIYSEHEAHDA